MFLRVFVGGAFQFSAGRTQFFFSAAPGGDVDEADEEHVVEPRGADEDIAAGEFFRADVEFHGAHDVVGARDTHKWVCRRG